MASNKTIVLLSIFLILLSSVFALQENFEVYASTNNVVACSNSVTTQSFSVRNTGDVESTYSITNSGDASYYTTYSETLFKLNPGQTKTVYFYVAPGSNEGSYNLETTVTSSFGSQKVIDNSFKVQRCENILLNVRTPAVNSNPCQVSQFIFDITNTGDYAETYDLNVKGLEDYTTLSANSLFLAPKEKEQVDVFVNPDCSIYGEKQLTFQATARTSQYMAETKVALDIAKTYDYDVTLQQNVNICNSKETSIPIVLTNRVSILNQYDIVVHSPSWLKQEAKTVELGPLASGTTNLVAYAEHPGNYPIDVLVKSIRGDVVKAGSINLTVEKCYAPNVNIDSAAGIIINEHSAQFNIDVKNEGTKADTYEFQLDSPSWVTANAVKSTLNPGETKTFTLKATPNETGSYKATINIISSETQKNAEDQIALKIVSAEDAYKLGMNPQNGRVLLGENYFKINLENKGILPATYDLVSSVPSWATLQQTSVTLEPGQKDVVVLATNTNEGTELGDYESQLTANVRGEQVGFVSNFNIKLRQLTLWQETELFVMVNWLWIVISVVVLLVVLFFAIFGRRIAKSIRDWKIRRKELAKIRAEQKAKKAEEARMRKLVEQSLKKSQPNNANKTLGIIFIILAFLILTGVIVYMSGYMPLVNELFKPKASLFEPIIQVNTTGLEAYGNTVVIRGTEEVIVPIIVKNNYNDDLVFGVEIDDGDWIETDTNKIELNSGEQEIINLRITPTEEIYGLYSIKVDAKLENENKVFSEEINLNIKQKSLWNDFLRYKWYVAAGLVLLVLGLIFKRKGKRISKTENIEYAKIKSKPARNIKISVPKRK